MAAYNAQITETVCCKIACMDQMKQRFINMNPYIPNEYYCANSSLYPFTEFILLRTVKHIHPDTIIYISDLRHAEHIMSTATYERNRIKFHQFCPYMIKPICAIVEEYLGLPQIKKFKNSLDADVGICHPAPRNITNIDSIKHMAFIFQNYNRDVPTYCEDSDMCCNNTTPGLFSYGNGVELKPINCMWIANFNIRIASLPKYLWVIFINIILNNIKQNSLLHAIELGTINIVSANRTLNLLRYISAVLRCRFPNLSSFDGIYHKNRSSTTDVCHAGCITHSDCGTLGCCCTPCWFEYMENNDKENNDKENNNPNI
jgi:hypothetical protein